MKITVGQLKKLIKEQVEEAKKASAVEKFHASLGAAEERRNPLVDAAIAAVNQGKSPEKVIYALKLATDDGQELMDILSTIAIEDKEVGRKLNAASWDPRDRRS
jgi:hypothetical protein